MKPTQLSNKIKHLSLFLLTEKEFDKLRKYSSISYVRENQDATSLAYARCGGNKRNNPLLSKSILKYLVYCQVFWIEVSRLQNQ